MKLKVTLDLNVLDQMTLKQLVGKNRNIQYDDYRSVIQELVKEKFRDLRLNQTKE